MAVAGSLSLMGTVHGEEHAQESRSQVQLLDVYGEQAALLADAGVGLIVLEMFDARWSAALRPALDRVRDL